jgi:hypothetical protein
VFNDMESTSAQDWLPSLRVAPQNWQVPEVPPSSGAPQVGQWAEEMLLSVSLFAPD